jgi:hypothetical protein
MTLRHGPCGSGWPFHIGLVVATIAGSAVMGSDVDPGPGTLGIAPASRVAAAPLADPPTELGPTVRMDGDELIFWVPEPDAAVYNVYRGRVSSLHDWSYGHVCLQLGTSLPRAFDITPPASGQILYYLVTKESESGEGPLGSASDGTPRPAPLPCVDSDGDRVADLIDNCPDLPNAKQNDTDFDSLGDACDDDDDNDGLTDYEEYLLGTSRVDWDSDDDGVGDGDEVNVLGSDPLSPDTDSDFVGDGEDNCPIDANSFQEDIDQDEVGDACDNCTFVPNGQQADFDADEFGDICDNCPYQANAGQTDDNFNGVGDLCETVAVTEVLDGGGVQCAGITVALDTVSVGQVASGLVAGQSSEAEVGFVNGAADE